MEAALAILSMEVGGTSHRSGLPWLPDRERCRWLPSPAGLSLLLQHWAWPQHRKTKGQVHPYSVLQAVFTSRD